MPKKPPTPCTKPGCKKYASYRGKCADHQPEPWASNKGKSRHERGYGSLWDKVRKRVLLRDSYLCVPCRKQGRLTQASQVDHIINKAQCGGDEMSNLQSICYNCHKSKTLKESKNGRHN